MNINFNSKNPGTNKIIGFILLFGGMFIFGFGFFLLMDDFILVRIIGLILLIAGAGLFGYSTIWMFRKVRCPHCGALLSLKFGPVSKCPYCKKMTYDFNDNDRF